MKVILDFRKSVEENAKEYFEKAKKAKKKGRGAEKMLSEWRRKEVSIKENREKTKKRTSRKIDWYERFRWCFSSDGFLIVGGRDATTNELLIKKHTEKEDVVFHTDMAGSPFIVVKTEGKEVPPTTLEEAAQFTAIFSRAWKKGLSSIEVFHVAPEQVTKEANSGEYLGKGAFMIRGKTTYHKPIIRLALGIDDNMRVMSGPPSAISKHCKSVVKILQGRGKTSDIAKILSKKLKVSVDDIVVALPAGGVKLSS